MELRGKGSYGRNVKIGKLISIGWRELKDEISVDIKVTESFGF